MNKSFGLVAAVLAFAPGAALGQWSDNFDTYSTGNICGQGGWQGWDGAAAACGAVSTTVARSAPNSQVIQGPTDSVHRYSDITSGAWRYTAWQFIPQDFTGITYFILNNRYNDGGPYNWAVELQFATTSGTLVDQLIDDLRTTPNTTFIRGAWAEIRVDFDLDVDTCSIYYNGELFSMGRWQVGGGPFELAAVDLYAGNSSSVFYDDMSLESIAGACPPCAADFNQDGGVDGSDVEAFFTAWEAGDSCGDVNQDGGVDGPDVEAFYTVWEAGGC